MVLTEGLATLPAHAQTADAPHVTSTLVRPGNVVVSGFSGTRLANPKEDAGKADADGVTIETNGAALRILDVSGVSGRGANPATDATEIAAVDARAIGQVFGIALDDAIDPTSKLPAPNIYAAATSAYGLNIVLPPADETGWPRRTLGGDPQAIWMAGQWGIGAAADGKPLNGGPGSIWRIDGVTGQVSLFATLATNGRPTGAPSLGNIAYDGASHQFFVSDLESGLIHRLSLTGQDLGTYDHGVTARTQAKLPAIPDDPTVRSDITSPTFRADDPNTWGFAVPSRRVAGLNVSAGRLYYAVADGPEIWSVAIRPDGDFGDARREISVAADQSPFEVTDISFDAKGWMYLAQRPPVTGTTDYLFLAAEAPAKLLRYRADLATNSWAQVPDEFLVGLTAERRQSDGGVALGYGYLSDGKIDYGSCDGTLWATGDDLDRNPRKTAALGTSDVGDGSAGLNVSGLQGSPPDPADLTAKTLLFADYDGLLPRAPTRGHIGDVRVVKACGSPAAAASEVVVDTAPEVVDLVIEKFARGPCRVDGICRIEVHVTNRGNRRYVGPLTVSDTLAIAGARLVDTAPSRWACGQAGADISCHHPGLDLGPGLSASVFLDYRLPARWASPDFADCADFTWFSDLNSPETIVAIEIELARLGLYTGAVDRAVGPKLHDAISGYSSAHGLAATGDITPQLIEALFGRGSIVPRERLHRHDHACAAFHVHVPTGVVYVPPPPIIVIPEPPIFWPPVIVVDCPRGYWNRNGTCERTCPWGYHAYGDRCLPDGGLFCQGGWIQGDRCACPNGERGVDVGPGRVACRRLPGAPQACFGGFLQGNRCQCPGGTIPVGGADGVVRCERPQIQCGGGALFNGQCRCPQGELLIGGRCVLAKLAPIDKRRIICPPGFVVEGERCAAPNRPPVVNVPVVRTPVVVPPRIVGQPPKVTTCPPGTIKRGTTCEPKRHDTVNRTDGRRTLPTNPTRTTVTVHGQTPTHPNAPHVVQRVQPPRIQQAHPAQPACRMINGKCVR